MKKLIIVLVLALTGNAVFAQSMVKVSTADKQAINVAVDSRYFNKRGTSVTVGDLPIGRHFLSIYGVVRKRNGKLKEAIIYEGDIITYNGMISIIVYNPANNTTSVRSEDVGEYLKHNTIQVDDPVVTTGGNNRNRYDNVPSPPASTTTSNKTTTSANDPDSQPAASPVAVDDMSTLADHKIDALKEKVTSKTTDTEKMKVFKDELRSERIAASQVISFSDWLNFEATKLEFAKWAYTICSDKENYATVGVLFNMPENKKDFDDFMSKHK